ncbi:hypothetical protein IFT84_17740 [Rhizobium sp. CFBP 8762]|uniref:hypothetical protein n=1 Tax=Rhizobium sp. CFBP 8762 TaxID=2775279 RepID=UPI001781D164|nr:hypothetical protein [Rhizobium sp. CFBP 8762]MBD8556354.1 hypothetical protein [Rhizobium sp. CFBP 8762]
MATKLNRTFNDMSEIFDSFEDTISALKGFRQLLCFALGEAGGDLKRDAYGISLLIEQNIFDLEQVFEGIHEQVKIENAPEFEIADLEFISRWAGTSTANVARVLWVTSGYKPASIENLKCNLAPTVPADTRARYLLKILYDGLDLQPIAEKAAVSVEAAQTVLNAVFTQDTGDTTVPYNSFYSQPIDEDEQGSEVSATRADPRQLRAQFIAERINEGVDAGDIAGALNLKRTTVEKVIARLLAGKDGDPQPVATLETQPPASIAS